MGQLMFSTIKTVLNALAFANVGHFNEFDKMLKQQAPSTEQDTETVEAMRSAIATHIRHAHQS